MRQSEGSSLHTVHTYVHSWHPQNAAVQNARLSHFAREGSSPWDRAMHGLYRIVQPQQRPAIDALVAHRPSSQGQGFPVRGETTRTLHHGGKTYISSGGLGSATRAELTGARFRSAIVPNGDKPCMRIVTFQGPAKARLSRASKFKVLELNASLLALSPSVFQLLTRHQGPRFFVAPNRPVGTARLDDASCCASSYSRRLTRRCRLLSAQGCVYAIHPASDGPSYGSSSCPVCPERIPVVCSRGA